MVKILQKTVFIGSAIVCVLYFLYALAFSTPWALGTRYGDFFTQAQEVNHLIFQWGLWTLLFSLLGLVFQSHNNRHLHLFNYVFLGLSVAFMAHTAYLTLVNVPPLKEVYLSLDTLSHRMVLGTNGLRALFPADAQITDIVARIAVLFDLGAWLAKALYVSAGLMLAVGLLKTGITVATAFRRRKWEEENAR